MEDNYTFVSSKEIWNRIWRMGAFNSIINDTPENYFEMRTLDFKNLGLKVEAICQRKPKLMRHLIIYENKEVSIELTEAEFLTDNKFGYKPGSPVLKIINLYERFRNSYRQIILMEKKILDEVERLNEELFSIKEIH